MNEQDLLVIDLEASLIENEHSQQMLVNYFHLERDFQ